MQVTAPKYYVSAADPAPHFWGVGCGVPNSTGGNGIDNAANVVGAIEFGYNMGVDATPNASNGVKGVGTGFSILSTSLTGYQVYNQYKKGNINPVDATSVTLGTIGITTKVMSWFGFGGATVSLIGEAAGGLGLVITVGQLWNNIYQPMNDMRYAPSYIDHNGNPVYGNPCPTDW